MTTLATNDMTIADAAKIISPSGMVLACAELLGQRLGIVKDGPWKEGDTNGGTISRQRTSLPTVYTKVANQVVAGSKSTSGQIMESPEYLEGWAAPEDIVLNYGGNPGAKMADETQTFVESLSQTAEDRVIYGSASTVGQLNGWAGRYASTTATNGSNIVLADSGASGGDQMSMWLAGWAPNKCYLWYPKGTPGGLQVEDFGRQPVTTTSGHQVLHRVRFQWALGIGLDDWRYLVRGANIDLANLIAGTGADLPEVFIKMTKKIPDPAGIRPAMYMNRTVEAWFDLQCRNDVQTGGQLSYPVVDGQQVTVFRGVPITICDRLTEAESVVS